MKDIRLLSGRFDIGGRRCFCSASHGSVCFGDPQVQDLLKCMMGRDLEKIFSPVQQPQLTPPSYKLLTDRQLDTAVAAARAQAEVLLQMPPELEERRPIADLLSHEPPLEGHDSAKFVFTDITLNVPHRERFIVVREPSGDLRKASWEERDRMVQIYFPKEGRKLTPPKLFTEDNLKVALSQDRHEEVLRRSLVQFEPDAADYKRVQKLVFEDVEGRGLYELLHSSRFFGALVWYLTRQRRIDSLLLHLLRTHRFEEAVCLVRLFILVFPQSECAQQATHTQASGIELLMVYAQLESQKKGLIELALQTYQQSAASSSS